MEGHWVILARVLRVPPAQAVVEEAAEVEVVAQGAAAHAGLEAPHSVVGLQALLEQRMTDIDRAVAAAAGHAAEHVAVEPDFIVTVAPPARVTFLTAGNTSHPDPTKPDLFPYIVAAGSFGLLARFSPYHGTNFNVRPRASYLVVVRRFHNGANGQIVASAEYVPRRTRNVPVLNSVEGVGFVCNDVDRTYRIAELVVTTGSRFHSAALVCFRSDTARWSKRELNTPAPLRVDDRAWVPHGTVAVNNTMIWYDLSWGLLTCDDLDGQGQNGLRFYNLPSGRGRTLGGLDYIHTRRCIALSGNLLRYVEVIVPPNNPAAATVCMRCRTLVGDRWRWCWNYNVSFEDIWNDATYLATGLPRENAVPDIVCISPVDPSVVYFAIGQRLFGVYVPSHVVLECVNFELVDLTLQPRQASGRFILPWNLQPIEDNVGHVQGRSYRVVCVVRGPPCSPAKTYTY